MRLMGIDYGEKRIGIAVSDQNGRFALPYGVLENKKGVILKIKEICRKKDVGKVIIGLPLDFKNMPTHATKGARDLKNKLEKEIDIDIFFEKEFLTTKEAERIQGKIKKIDASAAALILKSYIERINEYTNTKVGIR